MLHKMLVSVHYKSVVADIAKLDPKDETGVTAEYGFKTDLSDFMGKYGGEDNKASAADVRTAMDKFLADHPKANAQQKQETLMSMLNFYRPPKDNEAVIKLMDEVKKLDPETDAGKQAARIAESVKKQGAKE